MKKILLATLLTLLVAPFARAENTPPNFDSVRWTDLMNRMIQTGDRSDYQDGSLLGFTRLTPNDETVSHRAEYVNTIGRFIDDIFNPAQQVFVPRQVSAVSEVWTKMPDGNWDIDQKFWVATVNGELKTVHRAHIVKEANKISVIKYENLPVGAVNSPEELADWGKKLEEWY